MSLLITNIKQLITFSGISKKCGARPQKEDLSILEDAALLIERDKISWIGKESQVGLSFPRKRESMDILDAKRMVVLPGLIDPHTHLVFAGSRHEEFALRCEGKTYLEIAKEGGGILSTVRETQKASLKTLVQLGKERIQKAKSFGITTLEVKSGYGLSYEDEMKSLNVISELQKENSLRLIPTFLGAHDFPPEFKNKKEDYVALLCQKMIPVIAKQKLAQFCDVFIDEGFYTLSQTKTILETALKHGLNIRIHADEFKALGGTELAVSLKAKSVDHLIAITQEGINALSNSQTVATLLPGTSFYLGKTPFAPARKLIDAGVTVALGTDFNPGSSMTQHLLLVATIAATQMKMTLPEVLSAITYNAAKSLGLEKEIGSLEVGKKADLAFFDVPSYEYLLYHYGDNFCKKVIYSVKQA